MQSQTENENRHDIREASTLESEIVELGERFPHIAKLLTDAAAIKNKWFPLG